MRVADVAVVALICVALLVVHPYQLFAADLDSPEAQAWSSAAASQSPPSAGCTAAVARMLRGLTAGNTSCAPALVTLLAFAGVLARMLLLVARAATIGVLCSAQVWVKHAVLKVGLQRMGQRYSLAIKVVSTCVDCGFLQSIMRCAAKGPVDIMCTFIAAGCIGAAAKYAVQGDANGAGLRNVAADTAGAYPITLVNANGVPGSECVVCRDAPTNVVVVPCGHMVCRGCALRCRANGEHACVHCRVRIERVMPYLP